ncbi:hypothetical protein KIL84_014020 [Mauremys mutica]|uniref:Uncharacterized protein n=1 Tax=Mauremys mutica TaxID=74926 RepID=A0A9D3WYS1_9SAUR|nr:hypothetical protein KIL84_014020 [Mauremys mutica]
MRGLASPHSLLPGPRPHVTGTSPCCGPRASQECQRVRAGEPAGPALRRNGKRKGSVRVAQRAGSGPARAPSSSERVRPVRLRVQELSGPLPPTPSRRSVLRRTPSAAGAERLRTRLSGDPACTAPESHLICRRHVLRRAPSATGAERLRTRLSGDPACTALESHLSYRRNVLRRAPSATGAERLRTRLSGDPACTAPESHLICRRHVLRRAPITPRSAPGAALGVR